MKNLRILVLLLVVVGGLVGYFYWQDAQKNKLPADREFAVEDEDDIEKIFLADKMGRDIELTRNGDHWLVNGKYPVMQAKIDLLLNTLENLTVDMPVPNSARENAIKELAVKHIKVELFEDEDGKPVKTYFVGTPARDHYGNYMLMMVDGKNAEQPYVVKYPGFIGDLQVRFIMDEKDWRDTKIFDYALDDIKEVQVEYPSYPTESFKIEVLGADEFKVSSVQPLENDVLADKPLYTPGVIKYLNSFQKLNAEAYENEFAYKDSILQQTDPMAIIQVTDKKGATSKLTLYPMAANRRTKLQFDTKGNEIATDPDRYYGVFNNGQDFGLIQNFVFGKILRRRVEFYDSKALK